MRSADECQGEKEALRVLFFEDDAEDVELSVRALEAAQFEVAWDAAVTLDQFRERVRASRYDIILSDYRMPGSTGMDCLEALKAERIKTPFILLTGSLGDEKAVECLKHGVADYVLKDRLARLPVAVRRAIEEQQLRAEQAEAEEALRRSEASYRSLIQSAPCGILRADALDGRLLEANGALSEMLGYASPADLLHDSTADGISLDPQRLVREGCEPNGQPIASEVEWKHRNGTVLVIALSGRLLRDENGNPVCFEMIAENVTQRRRDQERIGQLNRLYSVLSRVGQAIVCIRERDELFRQICRVVVEEGRFEMAWVGLAEAGTHDVRLAASWGDAQGYLHGIRVTTDEQPSGMGAVGSAIRERRGVVSNDLLADPRIAPWRELAIRCNFRSLGAFPIVVDGTAIGAIAIYAARPGFFDDENVALLEELAANLSFALESIAAQQKREGLEDQLRRQNMELEERSRRIEAASRMKSQFLANMSHELRSPLNGIIGFTELLYDGKLGAMPEKSREFLNRIHKSAKHLLELINGVLDLSKVEAGRMEWRRERIQISQIVQEVSGILSALAAEKRILLETDLDSEVDSVIADGRRLKQVLYNFLSNALKFTPEGGRVTVRLAQEGAAEFRLEVSDTGIGIRAEDIPELFTEFHQLDATPSKRYQGTGLGLALTKRIVEAQGGRVGVRSCPGEGSTFYAVLPRNGILLPEETAILVIEEEQLQSFVLAQMLRRAGYAVETARTCAEAVDKCRLRRFVAITLDLLLPDGTGYHALEQIRALPEYQKTPIIVVSMAQSTDIPVSDDVQGFLSKPVDARELLTTLERNGIGVEQKAAA